MSNTVYIVFNNGLPQFVKYARYIDNNQYLVDINYDEGDSPRYKVFYDRQICKVELDTIKTLMEKYKQAKRMGTSTVVHIPSLDNTHISLSVCEYGLLKMLFTQTGLPFRFASYPRAEDIIDFNFTYDGNITTIIPLTKPARIVATRRNAYNPHHDAIYDIIKEHPYTTAEDIASYSNHDKEYVKKRLSELVDGGRVIQVGKKKSKKTKYMVYYYKAI